MFRSPRRTGLLRYSSAPASRQRSRSPGMARAVTAITGAEASRRSGCARRRRIVSRPSISGSWISIKTASGRISDAWERKSRPLRRETTWKPWARRKSPRSSKMMSNLVCCRAARPSPSLPTVVREKVFRRSFCSASTGLSSNRRIFISACIQKALFTQYLKDARLSSSNCFQIEFKPMMLTHFSMYAISISLPSVCKMAVISRKCLVWWLRLKYQSL